MKPNDLSPPFLLRLSDAGRRTKRILASVLESRPLHDSVYSVHEPSISSVGDVPLHKVPDKHPDPSELQNLLTKALNRTLSSSHSHSRTPLRKTATMPSRIAALDIETYGLGLDAAIAEVAMLVVELPSPKAYAEIPNLKPVVTYEATFPFLEQLELGRSYEPDTLKFHRENQGLKYGTNNLFPDMKADMLSCEDNLKLLAKVIVDSGIEELWLNHPTFDSGRLLSLASHFGIRELWNYRLENDLFTVRKLFNLKSPPSASPAAHRALPDCEWSLSVLATMGQRMPVLTKTVEA